MTGHDLLTIGAPVLVVGAGIMGIGIAQVAAQAGHPVMLYDTRDGAAADAMDKLAKTLDGLVAKGQLGAEAAAATLARIEPIAALDAGRDSGLVVEAIVEQLEAKRSLFNELEGIVAPGAVLATNTSSISVTAIANGLQHPGRLVGMHFFNPVPLMKLVEVVSGLQTDAAVAEAIFELAAAWGKTPVHAKSTPGFIVNRIARPYYAETLALLQEQAAHPRRAGRLPARRGLSHGALRADGPDRPRHQLLGDEVGLRGELLRQAFRALAGAARDGRRRPVRPQERPRLLPLRTKRAAAARRPCRWRCTRLPATARQVTVHGIGPIADHLEHAAIAALAPQGAVGLPAARTRQATGSACRSTARGWC